MKVNVFRKTFTRTGTAGSVFLAGKLAVGYESNADASTKFFAMKAHQQLPFTIAVNGNGGTPSVESIVGYAGDAIGELPTATYGNKWFEGWNDINGASVDSKSIVSEHIRTITARYTDAQTITFSAETEITGADSVTAWDGHALNASGTDMPTAANNTETGENFIGWYTAEEGGTKVTASTVYDGTYTTLYAQYAAQSYTVDLNSQWFDNTTNSTDPNGNSAPVQANPDSSAYDGVYASYSNYNTANGYAKMYIRLHGYTSFRIYIRSYAESSYDFTMAFAADTDVTSLPSTSTTGVVAHTKANQQSGTAIGNYTAVDYTLDGGEHYIMVCYRKDSSDNSGNDRGYVLIPKNQ